MRGDAVRTAVATLASLLVACSDPSHPPHEAEESELNVPSALLSARRPDVEFYLQKVGDRCELYWQRGDVRGPAEDRACYEDMLLGERLHIVGMVCMRESAEPSRVMPVVCPDTLTNLEKDYRKAAAASASAATALLAAPPPSTSVGARPSAAKPPDPRKAAAKPPAKAAPLRND